MQLLITGANGFIGSYVTKFFLKMDYDVIAASRYFHDSTKALLKGAKLITFDVLDNNRLNELSVESNVIIHTATANDIISKDTLKGIELSAVGTKNILNFAVRNKIPKCIVLSTLQVYGTELNGNISENSPLYFQNDYGLNHVIAEMYAEMFSRQGKVRCVSVRPSNVYGRIITDAFNRWSLVPGCFCKEAIESGTITIKSSGKQIRNFTSLENLCIALECILNKFPDNYETFNLASSELYSMKQVAEMVKSVYEKEFQKTVAINIGGTEPAVSNDFTVSLDKLKAIGHKENRNYFLENEIVQLFKYLESKNKI